MHVIVACRAKTETARQEIDGKQKVVKLGLKTVPMNQTKEYLRQLQKICKLC
jgi:hypothetical protein